MKQKLFFICALCSWASFFGEAFAQAKDPNVYAPTKQLISGAPADTPSPAEPEALPVAPPPTEPPITPDAEPVAPVVVEKPKPIVEWTLNLGANLNTGNTRSWGILSGTHLNLKQMPHEFDAAYAFNFGRADANGAAHGAGGYKTNTKNSVLQLRYNYWFTDTDAMYLGYIHRWDPFAGLQSRNRFDGGYVRKLWHTETQSLNGEVGVAYIWDKRVSGKTPQDQHNASGRLFLGYTNQINEGAKFATGVEALDNFNHLNENPTDIDPFKDVRVNWDTALTANLWKKVALEAKFLFAYDRLPAAAGLAKIDTRSALSLIVTLM